MVIYSTGPLECARDLIAPKREEAFLSASAMINGRVINDFLVLNHLKKY